MISTNDHLIVLTLNNIHPKTHKLSEQVPWQLILVRETILSSRSKNSGGSNDIASFDLLFDAQIGIFHQEKGECTHERVAGTLYKKKMQIY